MKRLVLYAVICTAMHQLQAAPPGFTGNRKEGKECSSAASSSTAYQPLPTEPIQLIDLVTITQGESKMPYQLAFKECGHHEVLACLVVRMKGKDDIPQHIAESLVQVAAKIPYGRYNRLRDYGRVSDDVMPKLGALDKTKTLLPILFSIKNVWGLTFDAAAPQPGIVSSASRKIESAPGCAIRIIPKHKAVVWTWETQLVNYLQEIGTVKPPQKLQELLGTTCSDFSIQFNHDKLNAYFAQFAPEPSACSACTIL